MAATSVRKCMGFNSITCSSSVMLYSMSIMSVDRVSLGHRVLSAS